MTKAIAVTTDDKTLVQDEKSEAEGFLSELDDFRIDDQEDLEFAATALADVKGSIKKLEGRKKKITDPLNTAIKEVRALFKPPLDILGKCERKLKDLVADAHGRMHEKQRQALTAAAEASKAGDAEGAAEAMEEAARSDFEPVKGLSMRHSFDFEVEDFDAVPDEYKFVDEAKVRAVIRAHKGAVNIPGIKVLRKSSVASGSR